MMRHLFTIILTLLLSSSVLANLPLDLEAVVDADSVVVLNGVKVIAQGGSDTVVNLRIQSGKLDLITKDKIPLEETDISVECSGGYLLGRLVLLEPPSFIVIDQDPRENIEALLDTKSHILLAVHEGEVIRSKLEALATPIEAPPPTATPVDLMAKWFAYTPPPVALPTAWDGGRKWNHWDSKYWSGVGVVAIILDRMRWGSQDAASETQVGDLEDFNGGEIRGYLFGAVGALKFDDPWIYTVMVATNAFSKGFEQSRDIDGLSVLDYRLDIPAFAGTTLAIGKQKEPISMERLMPEAISAGGIERPAAVDALLPSRNVGVSLAGQGFNQRMTWATGVFNDWYDSGQSFDESATQWAGRLTTVAYANKDESTLVHLGLGARWSDAKEGIRFRTEPEFNKSPLFADTGNIAADSSMTWDLEATLMQGPFMLQGEFLTSRLDSLIEGPLTFGGYHVIGSWVITGEKQPYNRRNGTLGGLPISRGVNAGGWGTWQVSARYSDLDLVDGMIDGGKLQIRSIGLNWWLSSSILIGVNYRDISLTRGGLTGHSSGLTTRLALQLQ